MSAQIQTLNKLFSILFWTFFLNGEGGLTKPFEEILLAWYDVKNLSSKMSDKIVGDEASSHQWKTETVFSQGWLPQRYFILNQL